MNMVYPLLIAASTLQPANHGLNNMYCKDIDSLVEWYNSGLQTKPGDCETELYIGTIVRREKIEETHVAKDRQLLVLAKVTTFGGATYYQIVKTEPTV